MKSLLRRLRGALDQIEAADVKQSPGKEYAESLGSASLRLASESLSLAEVGAPSSLAAVFCYSPEPLAFSREESTSGEPVLQSPQPSSPADRLRAKEEVCAAFGEGARRRQLTERERRRAERLAHATLKAHREAVAQKLLSEADEPRVAAASPREPLSYDSWTGGSGSARPRLGSCLVEELVLQPEARPTDDDSQSSCFATWQCRDRLEWQAGSVLSRAEASEAGGPARRSCTAEATPSNKHLQAGELCASPTRYLTPDCELACPMAGHVPSSTQHTTYRVHPFKLNPELSASCGHSEAMATFRTSTVGNPGEPTHPNSSCLELAAVLPSKQWGGRVSSSSEAPLLRGVKEGGSSSNTRAHGGMPDCGASVGAPLAKSNGGVAAASPLTPAGHAHDSSKVDNWTGHAGVATGALSLAGGHPKALMTKALPNPGRKHPRCLATPMGMPI